MSSEFAVALAATFTWGARCVPIEKDRDIPAGTGGPKFRLAVENKKAARLGGFSAAFK